MATLTLNPRREIADYSERNLDRFRSWYLSFPLWALLAVGVGVAWRMVRYFLQFPIWGDESFVCVNFLDQTLAGITGPLKHGQVCPLFFLWGELAAYQWLG